MGGRKKGDGRRNRRRERESRAGAVARRGAGEEGEKEW